MSSLSEPCCALKYYPEIEICVKEQKGEQVSDTVMFVVSSSVSTFRQCNPIVYEIQVELEVRLRDVGFSTNSAAAAAARGA